MKVQRVESLQFPSLEPRLSYSGSDLWLNFVQDVYKNPVYRFAVLNGSQPLGALSLVEVHHRIFGHYLVTAPLVGCGGFAFENQIVRDLLLDEARRLAQSLNVDYVALRFDENSSPPPDGWVQQPIYSNYLIDLPANPNDLLKRFSPNHRYYIRKSLKQGFQIRYGHLGLLDETYEAIACSMHELGSPYHSKEYLRKMAQHLSNAVEFVVLYDAQKTLIGGGVLIYQRGTIFNFHANILRFTRSANAGEFLYWSVIERAIQKGFKTFDLGRSLTDSGNDFFKTKWATQKKELAYWYWLAPGKKIPFINQKNPKLQLATAVWRRLPTFIVRPLGPYFIRGLL